MRAFKNSFSFIIEYRSSDFRPVLWEAWYKIAKDVTQTAKATSHFLCSFVFKFLNDIYGCLGIFETTRTKSAQIVVHRKTHLVGLSDMKALF